MDCCIAPSFGFVSCRRLAVCTWVVAEAIGHLFIGQLSIFLVVIGQISKVQVWTFCSSLRPLPLLALLYQFSLMVLLLIIISALHVSQTSIILT